MSIEPPNTDDQSEPPRPDETQTMSSFAARIMDGPGAVIGPYRLLQQIGEGGFGTA